ncbi:MAG: hypothetical protein WA765_18640 [Candidatus Acidiferrum sp.]
MRFLVGLILLVLNFQAQAQVQDFQKRRSEYMERAQVRHASNSATVAANSPRPLADAIRALSEEYAWVIDFEDPPYFSNYDLVDDTAPKWRAAHPNEKGVTVIGGGSFETQFTESFDARSSIAEEEHILDTVVSDYNKSGNPGRFAVINEGDGRFAVVGTHVKDDNGKEQAVRSILDTPITVQSETRNVYETVSAILDALTAKSHTKVGPGTMPLNALLQSRVTVGGQDIPSRVLLQQALSAAKVKLYWLLYYDSDGQSYALNVLPLTKAMYDASGKRTTVLVR